MKCAGIARHRGEYPLTLMCRVLGIGRATFYAWERRRPSARAREDAHLRVQVAAFHRRSRGTYGRPRLQRDLREAGQRVGTERVARLMRELGLVGCPPRRFRVTTQADATQPVAPNHLARRFAPGTPHQTWVADLTYVWTHEGWLYLAAVLDLASRRVVGWALRPELDRSVVLEALERALAHRPPPQLHHSDRGGQYASRDYQARLAAHGITCSMSRTGDCWDNAVVESFFSTLKRELLHRARWPTRSAATRAIADYVDGWYNPERRHSSLGYLSPMAYERLLTRVA
jgi:putative transposase